MSGPGVVTGEPVLWVGGPVGVDSALGLDRRRMAPS